MKEDKLSKLTARFFIITIVLIVLSIVVFRLLSSNDDSKFTVVEPDQLSENWSVNGEDTCLSFPAEVSVPGKGVTTFSCVLPNVLNKNMALFYNGCYCGQEVYVGDHLIYSYNTEATMPFGNMRGNAYALIPLKAAYAGKTLTIKMESPFNGEMTTTLNGIYYGGSGEIKFYLFMKNMWRFAFLICFLSISIFSLIFGLNQWKASQKRESNSFVYFALMALSVGVWVSTDTGLTQFFTNQATVVQYIAYTSLICTGSFYMGLCSCLFEKQRRLFQYLELAGFIVYILMLVLYVANICDPVSYMYVIYVYAFIYMFGSAIVILRHNKEYEYSYTMVFGTIVLLVGVMMAIIEFQRNPVESKAVFYFTAAYGFYILILFIVMMKNEKNIVKSSTLSKMYEKLAFTDELTELLNRAAYERAIDQLYADVEKGKSREIVLYMADLNFLKKINDEQGHKAGDAMIKTAANCLKEAFGKDGDCFRLGGDEFAVLMVDSKNQPDYYYTKLNEVIEQHAMPDGSRVSMAIAHASCSFPEDGMDLGHDLYRTADQRMYDAKIKMKAARK